MNRRLVLFGVAALLSASALAQQRVTGRVVGEDGLPVVGATVKVEGYALAVTTDENGGFALADVPASAKRLNVTCLGMEAQTVGIAGNVTVTLVASETKLGEVYVVAYGKATKSSFTGAATQIKGERLEEKSTTEMTGALQGEVAGVQVVNSDGNPGASSEIYIRGIGSLFSSSQPLIILDGVPYGGTLSGIDPKDIESINIMKDATASALYGSRGANGVVIVTTKHGAKSKLAVQADVKYTVSGRWLPTYDVIDSPERYVELTWESMRNMFRYGFGYDAATSANYASANLFSASGIPTLYNMWNADGADLINAETGRFNAGITRRYNPENWKDELYRAGQKVDAGVNLSGGNDVAQFYTALSYVKDKGYLEGSDFERINVRSNVDMNITDWLKGTVNLSYANLENNAPVQDVSAANNAFSFVNHIPPIYSVYMHDADGNLIADSNVGGWKYDYGDTSGSGRPYASGINPAGSANLDVNRTETELFTGTGSLEAVFLKDFKFTASLSYTYSGQTNESILNPYYGEAQSANGILTKTISNYRSVTANQIVNWSRTFNDVHHVSAFVGHESFWTETELSIGEKYNLVRADGTSFGNAVAYQSLSGYDYGYALDSYFGQVSYDYAEKYFVNASMRFDGSSRFAKGHRWGTFGSVGLAWNMKKEQFLKDVSLLHGLKLKASWGLVGNQGLLESVLGLGAYYPYDDLYSIGNINDRPSFTLFKKGNADLTWEKTSSFNVGVEFDLGGIVEGEFDYFNKFTYDMLFIKSVSPSLGYTSVPVNDGKMRNAGVEFSLVYHAIRQKDLTLDVRLNASHYKNKIVEMPKDDATGSEQYYYLSGEYYAWQKGHSIYDFYLCEYAGVDPATGYALYNLYVATLSDGTTVNISDMELFEQQYAGQQYTIEKTTTDDATAATRKFVGESAIPKLSGGLGFDLRYKNVTFGATFAYALGGKAFDVVYQTLMGDNAAGTANWHKDIENRWQQPGDVTDVPMLSNNSIIYANTTSTRFLTTRNYLQLTSLRLAWNVPEEWTRVAAGMNGVQIYATGENLFLLSARKGFMPGTSFAGESADARYLPSSNFTIGLKLNF
ncbi:MAG: SusC/RagA family TonB-linked outer membrane protein [Bacteroidales bacterium]|nr:SusC/RagA family TonB-linked outer membrane protein [Bacteroidales bacterium]